MNLIILFLFAYCTWMETAIAGHIEDAEAIRSNYYVNICSSIIECPAVDGPDSIYGPLEDCTKFCQCSNGVASVHNCPRDLHFNPILKVCDYPDKAGCSVGNNNGSDSDISDEGNNDGDNGDISSNSKEKNGDGNGENRKNSNGCEIECPLIDGPDSVYESLEDCTKFCQCSNGVASVHNCPRDLHFNPILKVCDYPDKAGCSVGNNNGSDSDISDEGNNDSDNGDSISSNSNEKNGDGNGENRKNTNGCEIECPLIDGPNSIYGPLEDCTKFCQCSNGVASVHNCPRDLHFNPILKVCDYPDKAGCSVGNNNGSDSDISDEGNNDGDNGDSISSNSNEKNGDGNGENRKNTNGCEIECPLIDGPDSVYESLEDCTKFCQCSNGIASVHNCPSGLHFNSILNVCDYPDKAGCSVGNNNSSDSDISDEENNNGDNGDRSSNSDEQISGDGNGEDGNSTSGCKIECPLIDGPDSVYESLEDCTKFCQCSNGIASVHSCPRGLHFNPLLNVCDFPDIHDSRFTKITP